jgi:hypothetical protein
MSDVYRILSPHMAGALAQGRVQTPPPRHRSAYDNPDFWGDALNWLGQTVGGIGHFITDKISTPFVGPGGSGSGLLPAPEKLVNDEWYKENVPTSLWTGVTITKEAKGLSPSTPFDVLAGVGKLAMDSPIGATLTGIGKAVVEWDPLKWVQESLKAGSETGWHVGSGTTKEATGPGTPPEPTGYPGISDWPGFKDGVPKGWNLPEGYTPSGGGTKNGGSSGTNGSGVGVDTKDIVTSDGKITNIYNYYYDPQAAQPVAAAANDGLMGSSGMFMMLLMMMMMGPMMGGFGGLQQTLRAEPKQADVSELLFY